MTKNDQVENKIKKESILYVQEILLLQCFTELRLPTVDLTPADPRPTLGLDHYINIWAHAVQKSSHSIVQVVFFYRRGFQVKPFGQLKNTSPLS